MKVYVTKTSKELGEKGDEKITGVFTLKKDAEAYCALGYGESVTECEVDGDLPGDVEYMYRYHVKDVHKRTVEGPWYILKNSVEKDRKLRETAQRKDILGNVIDDPFNVGRTVYLNQDKPELALEIVLDRIAEAKKELHRA